MENIWRLCEKNIWRLCEKNCQSQIKMSQNFLNISAEIQRYFNN